MFPEIPEVRVCLGNTHSPAHTHIHTSHNTQRPIHRHTHTDTRVHTLV